MAASDAKLFLYDTATVSQFAEVESEGLDVFFPESVRGWSDVLDCRIPPYTERTLEELCEYAFEVRKFYVLVTEDQVTSSAPVAD